MEEEDENGKGRREKKGIGHTQKDSSMPDTSRERRQNARDKRKRAREHVRYGMERKEKENREKRKEQEIFKKETGNEGLKRNEQKEGEG